MVRCRFCNLRFLLNVAIIIVSVKLLISFLSLFGSHFPRWVYSVSRSTDNSSDLNHGFNPDESSDSFLERYTDYCRKSLLPNISNLVDLRNGKSTYNESDLCNCVPKTLVGGFPVNATVTPSLELIASLHPDLKPGGRWFPGNCIPRQRVAVIIPFRDRELHLKSLLHVLHPMLKRQQLDYTIFVVEQAEPDVFNKAMLMNAGFKEASNIGAFDCFIFHDVDLLPEDDRNFYVCSSTPRHIGAFIKSWDYKLPYHGIFGGVTAFTRTQFEQVNGFSNQYYGWGGEDDDMFKRVKARGFEISRFPRSVARFVGIKHEPDDRNPFNVQSSLGYQSRPTHYSQEGLNSVVYTKKSDELRPLYRWLFIALPPLPKNFRGYNRRTYRNLRGSCRTVHDFGALRVAAVSAVLFLSVSINLFCLV